MGTKLARRDKGDGLDTLTELAIKYGTDKWGKHHYTPVYYALFHNKNKRRAVKKVLEIGPAEGAGLFMFRDFFTTATIYGAEIDQDRVDRLQALDLIEVYKCDQTNSDDLLKLVKKTGLDIDVVIDDGSHVPEHQIFTCLSLMEVLKKGCLYIIEDVADPSIADELKKYHDVEVKKVGDRYDDCLVIVRHKSG